jgi:phage gp16-like protein
MARSLDESRKPLLAKIHIAKKQLKLDDEEYRAILTETTQKTSCKDMSGQELGLVLAALKRMGFKAQARAQDPGPQPEAEFVDQRPVKLSPPSQRKTEKSRLDKIRALWIDGFGKGVIKQRGEEALAAFAKRLTGVDRLEWLQPKQQNAVIQALVKMGCGSEQPSGRSLE